MRPRGALQDCKQCLLNTLLRRLQTIPFLNSLNSRPRAQLFLPFFHPFAAFQPSQLTHIQTPTPPAPSGSAKEGSAGTAGIPPTLYAYTCAHHCASQTPKQLQRAAE